MIVDKERLVDLLENLKRLKREMIETEQHIASIQTLIKQIQKSQNV